MMTCPRWKKTPSLLFLSLVITISSVLAFTTPRTVLTPQPPSLLTAGRTKTTTSSATQLWLSSPSSNNNKNKKNNGMFRSALKNAWKRMDTLEASGLKKEYSNTPPLTSGILKLWFYGFVGIIGFRWYRAKYINKLGFWEKQPQWNMMVTSKEQDDALRAYTCQNCGSTMFIARNREAFFEGAVGLGGKGCFTCGSKGVDNFVMNRKEIMEELDDSTFDELEQPLDFVSEAERQGLLDLVDGNEDAANELLKEAKAEEAEERKPKAGGKNDAAETAPPPMFAPPPPPKETAAAEEEEAATEEDDEQPNDDDDDLIKP